MTDIQRPIELAGLRGRLLRAKKTEAAIQVTGARYDKVLDAIDEKHKIAEAHVGQLENYDSELGRTISSMIAGDNGGPTEGDQDGSPNKPADGQTSNASGQAAASAPQPQAGWQGQGKSA